MFLKSMEDVDVAARPAEADEAVTRPAPEGLTVGAVLSFLKRKGETRIIDVAVSLESPLLETAALLGTLQASGLVTIQGNPGAEVVALTKQGKTLATVA
jgi:hypothetical protein